MEAIELFHNNDTKKLREKIKDFIDFKNLKKTEKQFKTWDLDEAKYFISYQPDSVIKKYLQYGIWYLNGDIDGKQVCDALEIEAKNV